jgi:hypothetical protein
MATLLLVALATGQAGAASANPSLAALLERGLPIDGLTYKFPAPLLPDKFDAAQEQSAIEKAADRHPVELFVRKSPYAPFTLKIESFSDDQGQRQGQTIDLFFVAHGTLEALKKKDILNQLIRSESKEARSGEPRFLSADELQQRKITPVAKEGVEERYAHLDLWLLDKVHVTGVTDNVQTRTPKTVTMVSVLDPKFAKDAEFPNRWQAIQKRGDDEKISPAQPYAGFGGYVRVYELSEPAGSLLVESHFAFHEPQAWFEGKNYIRAKMPIAVQNNVRTFRRQLLLVK